MCGKVPIPDVNVSNQLNRHSIADDLDPNGHIETGIDSDRHLDT